MILLAFAADSILFIALGVALTFINPFIVFDRMQLCVFRD